MSESLSNSDKLRQERASFANVRMPLAREDDLAGGELPFIVAVVDDLSGNSPGRPKPDLSERTFDKVSRNTLNEKMAEVSPGLEYDVKCTLPASMKVGERMHVGLKFNSMQDFEPGQVAGQIPALNKLLRLREQLQSLKARVSSDPQLAKQLEQLIKEIMPQS